MDGKLLRNPIPQKREFSDVGEVVTLVPTCRTDAAIESQGLVTALLVLLRTGLLCSQGHCSAAADRDLPLLVTFHRVNTHSGAWGMGNYTRLRSGLRPGRACQSR